VRADPLCNTPSRSFIYLRSRIKIYLSRIHVGGADKRHAMVRKLVWPWPVLAVIAIFDENDPIPL